MATKNLPANIIDKVQVVDRRSDQAQFTGIEDDNTEKVINLTLRPGNRNGLFGRASLGYGTDDRYNGNGMISYFQGETQLAALLSTNNTNNIGFTDFMGDAMSNMGGGGRRMGGGGRGGGGGGNRGGGGGNYNLGGFSINSGGGGVNTTTSGGANINYRFGEKLKLGGNYYFNIVDSKMEQQSIRENILPDSVFYYTFYNCPGLSGTIPANMFGNINGAPADSMFRGTFGLCSGLTGSIPAGLFGTFTGNPASGMFLSTFQGCTGLTGIEDGIWDLHELTNTSATNMFSNTFNGATNITSPTPKQTRPAIKQPQRRAIPPG